MTNSLNSLIEAFIVDLQNSYIDLFGHKELINLSTLSALSEQALETIALSNAPYHDVHHTMMVTSVGNEILKSKHLLEKNVTPYEWMHFTIAALYHDIGYFRGLCTEDKEGEYIKNKMGETVKLSSQATDAVLAPYHVDRAKLFAQKALKRFKFIDTVFITQLIERTRFPVPHKNEYQKTYDMPGLLRAADLIGQLADINYHQKSDALYRELKENGTAKYFGYSNSSDLKYKLPAFFKKNVLPYITDALAYLKNTHEGQIWINNLFFNIHRVQSC